MTKFADLKSFYLKNLNDTMTDSFAKGKTNNLIQHAQQLRLSKNGGLTYKKKGSSAMGLFKKAFQYKPEPLETKSPFGMQSLLGRSMSSVEGHQIQTSKKMRSHMVVDRDNNDYQSIMCAGQSTIGTGFNQSIMGGGQSTIGGGQSIMGAMSTFTTPSIMTKGNCTTKTDKIKSKIKQL